MKLKNFGRAVLALAASAGSLLGMTSCSRSYTVGYFFVTGAATGAGTSFGQVASFRIQNDTGQLRQTSIVGSNGTNPIQAIVNPAGTYLYVLNGGCGNTPAQAACSNGGSQASQIDQFSIGGSGVLTHQQSFNPQGKNTLVIQLSGNFLYALDQVAPNGTVGDVSVFSVDPSTGRLSPVLNTQAKDPLTGLPLSYFPVGTNPTWLTVGSSYAFIAEQGPASGATAADPQQAIFIYNTNPTSGQLTLTQSTPTPTGATQLTYVYANSSTLYALDAGTKESLQNAGSSGAVGQILPYTVGANGVLSAIAPALNNAQNQSPVFPARIIKENGSHNFLWVANAGINTNLGATASVITAYLINSNQQLSSANTGAGSNGGNSIPTGASPRCIVEDPSNQYLYTVNFNDSTITGKKINFNTGGLDTLPKPMPPPPGSPTWCAVSGSTF